MEDLQNHLEEVIADMAEGSESVEPHTHLEKVIQATGQAIAEGGGGAELFRHTIKIVSTTLGDMGIHIINNIDTPLNYSGLLNWLGDNGYNNSTDNFYPVTMLRAGTWKYFVLNINKYSDTQIGLKYTSTGSTFAVNWNEIQVTEAISDTVYDMEGELV